MLRDVPGRDASNYVINVDLPPNIMQKPNIFRFVPQAAVHALREATGHSPHQEAVLDLKGQTYSYVLPVRKILRL